MPGLFKKVFIFSIPVVLIGICYFAIGCFHETNDDPAFDALIRGAFIGTPNPHFYLFHILSSSVFFWFYQMAPSLPWYPLFFFLLLAVSFYNIFRILHRDFEEQWKLYLAFIILFSCLFIDDVVFFSFTRVTCLAAGTAILRISILINGNPEKCLDHKSIFWQVLILVIAFLSRPESLILGLAVCLPALLTISENPSKKKGKQVLAFLGVSLLLFLISTVFSSDISKEFIDKHQYTSTYLNSSLEKDWAHSEQDSILRTAAINWFIIDWDTFTKDKWAKMSYAHPYRKESLSNLNDKRKELWSSLKKHHLNFLLLQAIIMVICLLSIRRPQLWQSTRKLLIYQAYFFMFLFAVTVFIKMPERVLSPATALMTVISIALLIPAARNFYRRNDFILAISLALLMISIPNFKILNKKIKQFKTWQAENESVYNDLNASFFERTFVYLLPSMSLTTDNDPFCPPYLEGNNHHILMTGWPSTLPSFKKYLQDNSVGNSFINSMEGFSERKPLFISYEGYNGIIGDYFKAFYLRDPVFTRIDFQQDILEKRGLQLFEFSGFIDADSISILRNGTFPNKKD